ncbi:hypothetical protein SPRG_06080 [Saprolegnia parasitica CBS 223.65]|uniref:Cyclic nucleotide-binding domain-containing protein n=1 Tax=Saprolegnia parasitica (strain CBS 223.65) TaxID=695850 RepID=A0A067CIL1_SAPPC|nr:hypothetical protein SPRG_06080 [Saprolegnia parasitica CBS 223.65]KDO29025.1 hypothetical protein SPRG_06080 [Saprolegnia parasitica CBS 223.65]|eukprot:XP_012200195.1 hypothetical protein SPRG_06080 [Saprolegnia parasitica CBS 223.65]
MAATLKVTELPRGGSVVSTSIGPIQYGMPPETIKDSMALGLPVPMYFIVPSEPFTKTLGPNMGVNVAEFEFPAYCNFFFKRQCVNLIVASQEVEDRIRRVFQETLFGPQVIDMRVDFPHAAPTSSYPNLEAELGYFRKFGSTLITLEMLLKFTHFRDDNIATLLSGENKVTIQKTEHGFVITDNGAASALIEDFVRLPPPAQCLTVRDVFYPPAFGVTVLGNSHGFDPNGNTSGYVLWINHRGIMVDPPPFSTSILIANSIPPLMIDGVIVTHCHADHDAGTFQKILQEGRVSLITTQTIYQSFLRKYAALSGFEESFLKRVLNYRKVRINDPTSIRGATFRFFYSLHSIPCVGFEVTYGSKRIVFSGDHLNDVERIRALKDEGVLSEHRCNELLAFPWDCDVILHEAGVPPIHTPDIPADSGLRAAPEGVQNTIIVPTEQPESASTLEVLDLVRKVDIFVDLTLADAYELVQMARRVDYAKAVTVQEYGSVARSFYIVVAGEAQAVFPPLGARTDTSDRKRLSTVPKSKRYIPGDYFDLQYLLTPNMRAGCSIIAASSLCLLEFNAADINWFLQDTSVFERIQKLVETRHNFAWDTIAENSIFTKLTQIQRTQLELTLGKWNVPENFIVWNTDEACDIAVFVADGEFVMKTWTKPTSASSSEGNTPTEPRGPPRKRKGSVNRVVPIDSVTSGQSSECLHAVFRRGAFIGNVNALTSDDECAFGSMLVAKTAGTLFCIKKPDFKFFLFENPGILMALSDLTSVI